MLLLLLLMMMMYFMFRPTLFVCCQLLSEMIGFSAAESLVSFAFSISDSRVRER